MSLRQHAATNLASLSTVVLIAAYFIMLLCFLWGLSLWQGGSQSVSIMVASLWGARGSSKAEHSKAARAIDGAERVITRARKGTSVQTTLALARSSFRAVNARSSTAAPFARSLTRMPTKTCLKAPVCMEPPGSTCMNMDPTTMVLKNRPECPQRPEFCHKSVYRLPKSGLIMTLPMMTAMELATLYSGPGGSNSQGSKPSRSVEHAKMIMRHSLSLVGRGPTIVEMGCAAALLLYNLRTLAGPSGELMCFEVDPEYHRRARITFKKAEEDIPGLKTTLVPRLVDFQLLEKASVDIFLSSHVLEHLPSLCPFFEGLKRILKPGGLVFTEVPVHEQDIVRGTTRGTYHLLYFSMGSFLNVMRYGGFELVHIQEYQNNAVVRSLFRWNG